MSRLDPFQKIIDFDAHYRQQIPLHAATLKSRKSTMIVFRAGDTVYALPVSSTMEILAQPPGITPLPMVKPWVVGLYSWQGVLYPIVHLASLIAGRNLRDGQQGKSETLKLLLLRSPGLQCGLLVDAIIGVESLEDTANIVVLDREELLCSHQLNRLVKES